MHQVVTLGNFLSFLGVRGPSACAVPRKIVNRCGPCVPCLCDSTRLSDFFLTTSAVPIRPITMRERGVYPIVFEVLCYYNLHPRRPLGLEHSSMGLASNAVCVTSSGMRGSQVITVSRRLQSLYTGCSRLVRAFVPNQARFFRRPSGGGKCSVR